MKSETSAPGGQSATQNPPVFTGAEDGTGFWHHLSRTASLALPVMLSRAGMVLMLTVDTAIVGHLAFADRGLAAFGAAPIPPAGDGFVPDEAFAGRRRHGRCCPAL